MTGATTIIYALAVFFGALGGLNASIAGGAAAEDRDSPAIFFFGGIGAVSIGIALLLAALPAWL